MNQRLSLLLTLIVLIGLPVLTTATALACPMDLPVSTLNVAGHELEVEIASTKATRVCGLSNRANMPENHGMLFVLKAPQSMTVWMKNTHFPLSIAFIDAQGRIINIHTMEPERSDKFYHADGPTKYALEVNQGWFEAHGVGPGDTVDIRLPLVLEVQ